MAARPTVKVLRSHWLTRAVAIIAACGIAACTTGNGGNTNAAHEGGVRVDVTDIAVDQPSGSPYVELEDHSGKRSLQIVIDDAEARAIMLELHGVKPPRPLSADLLRSVIKQTGNEVDRVEINDLRDEIYYARIYLDHDRYSIDSRPSDAIALAIGTGAPIYVAPRLMRSEASASGAASPAPITAITNGVTVQELSTDVAAYFGVAAHGGVIVADVDAAGERAGLRRGDIVTAIAGHRITMPSDFAHAAKAVTDGPISLTILRDGRTNTITVPLNRAARAAN
jgi:bifunctional DNase/RNase